jgi:hypothetical protein
MLPKRKKSFIFALMKTTKNFLAAASISLALALTFSSCLGDDIVRQLTGSGGDDSSSSDDGGSSSGGGSSSSVEGDCYFYENGKGGYDYKCGMEPPCYPNPSCPECDGGACYPYPTKCNLEQVCLEIYPPKCNLKLVCQDIFQYVHPTAAPNACCQLASCYENPNGPCPDVCVPAVKIGNGNDRYACGIRSSSSIARPQKPI